MGVFSFLVIVALLVVALAVIVGWLAQQRQRAPDYARRKIMTENEAEFFGRLVSANPDGYVFPQVAMSALIGPTARDAKARMSAFGRIAQKRVDYAIYTRALELICVIELDDRTHRADRDAARDALLTSAGITTVRWQSAHKPSVAQIRARLEQLRAAATVTATAVAE